MSLSKPQGGNTNQALDDDLGTSTPNQLDCFITWLPQQALTPLVTFVAATCERWISPPRICADLTSPKAIYEAPVSVAQFTSMKLRDCSEPSSIQRIWNGW